MLFSGNSTKELFIRLSVPSIDTIITDHFEILFWDVLNETFHEFEGRDGFFNVFVILMPVVMEGDHFTIVLVYTLCCDDGSSKIATDILGNSIGIALAGFGINIKAIFMISVDHCFCGLERWTDMSLHLVQKSGTERISQIVIIKVSHFSPGNVFAGATFADKAVYMRIPLKAAPKGVKYTYEARCEVFGFIHL